VAPSAGPALAASVARALDGAHFFDWGGGLVWLAVPAAGDGGAAVIRGAVAAAGGHATLIRAPDALRNAVPVFAPQPPALAALTRRVKESFDPKRILNRGRMYGDV
jgi:glycolate oxidase FAD binding subunit